MENSTIVRILGIREFANEAVQPAGLADNAAAAGGVIAVVDLIDAFDGGPPPLVRRSIHTVPGVIIGFARGATSAITAWGDLTDVVLCDSISEERPDEPGSHRGVAVPVGPELDSSLERLVRAVTARPKAAAALAVLLRGEHPGAIEHGLVTESAVYSMLQAGPEFAAWRRSRVGAGQVSAAVPSSEPVIVTRAGRHLTVTLARPDRHSALNTAMRDAIADALAVGVADQDMQIILRGAGPSFCSGGDLSEFGTAPDPASAPEWNSPPSPTALSLIVTPSSLFPS